MGYRKRIIVIPITDITQAKESCVITAFAVMAFMKTKMCAQLLW
jgi:hypothetical protein